MTATAILATRVRLVGGWRTILGSQLKKLAQKQKQTAERLRGCAGDDPDGDSRWDRRRSTCLDTTITTVPWVTEIELPVERWHNRAPMIGGKSVVTSGNIGDSGCHR